MEYHSERFEDFSLLVYKRDKIVAVLPANKKEDTVYSHQGLTYGGLVLAKEVKFEIVVQVFNNLLKYLEANAVKSLILKQIPSIYTILPNDEIWYLMFILKTELIRRDTLSVINLYEKLKISNNRLEGFKRGKKNGLIVKEEDSFELFWNAILIKNLKKKHNASPVHTLEEITWLKSRFPNNVRQFNVYRGDKIVAGTTVFESKYVAHSQYISGDENKNSLGSLDFLHFYLINDVFKEKKYFDFGTSNENNGSQINKGLQFWKEGFGARTIIQDFYKIETKSYAILNDIFL
ncbi:acetyltransferase (GNAT) family protein [Mariniflexile fucanivorans]|uniref:Acetyltransferase (GNAT) family protein n=1 Tax=Mariniflexile fucanivorans TaxID=264023 RepID=A0A4R1RKQ9_9FLAO|nr:GNAT family N-acetyltransferase [Mariniflexile fucanivorans]TCL66656.1 acetyltransferase (GNAT) family protein [Mariniflexile fucanivorans]